MAPSVDSSPAPSLPPPRPKSPPEYPDLYGKRRELAKVLMLEREIDFLEEEMKYVEGLQPASPSCKEVADYVVANSDPLIPVSSKVRRSRGFWKWLCGKSSFYKSWICCYGCSPRPQTSRCCNSNLRVCCSAPTCRCFFWPSSQCFSKISRNCCTFRCNLCLDFFCCKWKCCCPKCPKVNPCLCCTENCCYSCCLCY
ncbi:hypothetical protein LguiA_003110 [Lonicera macranthoides]